jgi:uncharacterized protein YdeI (YjbR/CyaY-like superfamily)
VNARIDAYIDRSTAWPAEMRRLREVLLATGLSEDMKWGKPCYLDGDRNIAIMQEMKAFLALMFFKGALMPDPAGVLHEQGPNSRSAKRMTFTSVADVDAMVDVIADYVRAAIATEDAGVTAPPAPALELADVLQARLDTDPAFAAAFNALTPSCRREYNMHFTEAKQLATREARLAKYADRILAGKRMRDR